MAAAAFQLQQQLVERSTPLPLLSECWPAAGSGLASAPRWGEAVVEHEHTLHVEALGDVRHELVRGGAKALLQ